MDDLEDLEPTPAPAPSADRPLLGVLEHVLDHLDRRDGEREVVALAVAARLEQRLVGELRRVERRDVAQVRLKGDGVG